MWNPWIWRVDCIYTCVCVYIYMFIYIYTYVCSHMHIKRSEKRVPWWLSRLRIQHHHCVVLLWCRFDSWPGNFCMSQKEYTAFFFFFFFLGAHLWHMEVPQPGVKSELQLLVYATASTTWDLNYVCNLHHRS